MTAGPSGSLPQARTPRSIAPDRLVPSGAVQRCSGWMTICGSVPGESATVYGAGPRKIAMSPGETRRGSPPSTVAHASSLTIDTSVSGASSWTRIDHGGLSDARSRNAPRARGPSSRSVRASMDPA